MTFALSFLFVLFYIFGSIAQDLVYDLQQFDHLDLNDTTIQWDYKHTDKVLLNDDKCFDSNFKPWRNGVSSVRLLFDTKDFAVNWRAGQTLLGFQVLCNKQSNTRWWNISVPHDLKDDLPYTRITVNVGQCHKSLRKRVTGIIIKYSANNETLQWSSGIHYITPLPKGHCTRINTFKTLYLQNVTF